MAFNLVGSSVDSVVHDFFFILQLFKSLNEWVVIQKMGQFEILDICIIIMYYISASEDQFANKSPQSLSFNFSLRNSVI